MIVLIDEVDRLVRLVLPLPEEIASEIGKTMLIDNGLDFILVTFSAVILAAVAEEAIFRGMLQQSVEKHVDVTKGVIYSSIAWALVHGNHYMMLQIFLFGFFSGMAGMANQQHYSHADCTRAEQCYRYFVY